MKSALIFSICAVFAAFISAKSIAEDLNDPRSWFYDHATVKPVVYSAEKGKRDVHSNSAHAEDELVLEFEAFDKKFEVNLHMNKALLSEKYFEEQEEDGEIKIVYPMKDGDAKHCHYQGHLKGVAGSWAALSMCDGISGAIFDGKETYYVEPDHMEDGEHHFVFKASDMKSDDMQCGVSDVVDYVDPPTAKDFEEVKNYKTSKEISTTQYVELGYVVDNAEYSKLRTTVKTNDKCKAIANLVNTHYASLNVSVSLVGIKIWRGSDEIPLGSNISPALDEFAKYRRGTLVNEFSHDVAQLISGQTFEPSVKGIAFVSAMCGANSCGVIKDYNPILGHVGATSAHEMGHNFGMRHDFSLTGCTCPTSDCLMSYSSNVRSGWSSCSVEAIDKSVNSGRLTCLSNVPTRTVN